MLTKSLKADVVAKIQALQEVQTKDFTESEVGKTFAGLPEATRKILAAQEAAARAEFEKANGAPEKSAQYRFAAIELLSEVFAGQDSKDFAEGFNLLKAMVQNRLGLVHFSEKELCGGLIKSLRGEVGGISKELADKFLAFLGEHNPDKRNFSACIKVHSLTHGLGTLLVGDIVRLQNLHEAATPKQVEDSTLTIKEALEFISEGKTPYKVAKTAKK